MGKLIPNEVLIYERSDGTVYARYRDPPYDKIPRWVVGTQSFSLEWQDWIAIKELAKENETIRKQLDKLMVLYYTIKNPEEN